MDLRGNKSKRWLFGFLSFFLMISVLRGQDPHFSQFYASPLTLNPALAGTYQGTFRISTIYRDQWIGAVDNSLRTYSMSGDAKFDLDFGSLKNPDQIGIGITFMGDRVGTFDFNSNQILLSGAYHKLLDYKTKQYIGIGIQGGIIQRGINYENLRFQDQFNAVNGFTLSTNENLPPNSRSFTDLSAGIYYTVSPSKNLNFHAGLGYFHANKPNISYYNIPEIIDPEVIKSDTLNAKFSFHTGLSYGINYRLSIQPRVNALIQKPYLEANIGATFRYKLQPDQDKYLLIGPYFRGTKSYDGFRGESIITMLGLELNNLIIGMSYDQNIKNLISDRRSLSSFEISLIYIGEHSNENNICPQF